MSDVDDKAEELAKALQALAAEIHRMLEKYAPQLKDEDKEKGPTVSGEPHCSLCHKPYRLCFCLPL